MKIKITKTPKVTYSKLIYDFKVIVEDIEYQISRHDDDNGVELFVDPQPEKDEVYDAIESLFYHRNFHYNTTQEGEEFSIDEEW